MISESTERSSGGPFPRDPMNMILDGKYHLIAELGQGGMAVVHLAVVHGNMGFRKLAVVKLLRSNYVVDPDFVEMFLDEARLCARLSHPNIVHTYEVGVDEGQHYLAMEFLDGVSLQAAMSLSRNGGPFKMAMQARILLDVLEGLRYAHDLRDYDGKELQIVHRDISPQNIFITFDGQVKLLDFGIAKAANSVVETAAGVIKGKLTYMAPEQARGEAIDGRADLHAVGVMLWEAVAGRRRWANVPQPAVFVSLAGDEPTPSPNGAKHGYPEEFDRVALRACESAPGRRYQTAADFHRELESALRSVESVSLRDVGAMLSDAFAEDRRRIQRVIEQRVQEIESGRPPTPIRGIPTARPKKGRGEDSNSSSKRMLTKAAGDVSGLGRPISPDNTQEEAFAAESTERLTVAGGALTRSGSYQEPPSADSLTPYSHVAVRRVPRRSIIIGVALACVVGGGLALLTPDDAAKPMGADASERAAAAGRKDAARSDNASAIKASGGKTGASGAAVDALGSEIPAHDARAPVPNGGAEPIATGRGQGVAAAASRAEAAAREARALAQHRARLRHGSAPVEATPPAEPIGVSEPKPADEPAPTQHMSSPLQRTTSKPKVQLDTENPWK